MLPLSLPLSSFCGGWSSILGISRLTAVSLGILWVCLRFHMVFPLLIKHTFIWIRAHPKDHNLYLITLAMTLFPIRSHSDVLGVSAPTYLSGGHNSTHSKFLPSSSESPGWSWTSTFRFHMLFSSPQPHYNLLFSSMPSLIQLQVGLLCPFWVLKCSTLCPDPLPMPSYTVCRQIDIMLCFCPLICRSCSLSSAGLEDNHKDRSANHPSHWHWPWARVFEPVLWALPLFSPVWWLLWCPSVQIKPLLIPDMPRNINRSTGMKAA